MYGNLLKNITMIMLYCYTKQTTIKAIKMIAINSKMKKKKEKPIKTDQISKVVDRWFFCFFKLGFSSFNFV